MQMPTAPVGNWRLTIRSSRRAIRNGVRCWPSSAGLAGPCSSVVAVGRGGRNRRRKQPPLEPTETGLAIGVRPALAGLCVINRLSYISVALVLQPGFIGVGSPLPMAAAGALLVPAPPHRPGENVLGIGRMGPDQTPQQPAEFGHGVGQQIQP